MNNKMIKFFTIGLMLMSALVSYSQIRQENTFKEKVKPIQVDKEDGFYETIDYTFSTKDKDIKLTDNPSLTTKDIFKVKKTFNKYSHQLEISIRLTKDGAQKFYLLTKRNIRKPIAIVIDNQIVSMPIVQSEIKKGKVSISGDFSHEEIDEMVKKLKGK